MFVQLQFGADAAQADALHIALTIDGTTYLADTPYKGGTTLEIALPKGLYQAGKTVGLVLVAERNGGELARALRDDLVLPTSCAAFEMAIGNVGALDGGGDQRTGIDQGMTNDQGSSGDLGSSNDQGTHDQGATDAGLSNSSPCINNSQCHSTFCVDGVCCNASCTGQCEACDVSNFVGQCVPVTPGDFPHGPRAPCAGGSSVCAGVCTAASRNACTYPGPAITCATQSCSNGTKRLASGCDQAGNCSPQQTQVCPMGCLQNDCLGACTADNQCSTANPSFPYCDNGICTAKKPQGRTCTTGSECTSTNCADGYCCNSSCTGQCESCKQTGSLGTCVKVTGAVVTGSTPSRTACGGTVPCNGTCDGSSTSCVYPGPSTTCGAQSCSMGTLTPVGACNSTGICAQPTQTCPNGACNASGTDCGPCSNDMQCGSNRWCNAGTCQNKGGSGAACMNSNECVTNICTLGTCCNVSCSGTSPACSADGTHCVCNSTSCSSLGSHYTCDGSTCICTPSCPACVAANNTSDGCGGTCIKNCSSTCCFSQVNGCVAPTCTIIQNCNNC